MKNEETHINGYKVIADACRKLLGEEQNIDKENTLRKIKTLDFLSTCTEQEINELFNSSAFNNIVKGYFLMACNNIKLDTSTSKTLLNELNLLFSEKTADEAETYYYKH